MRAETFLKPLIHHVRAEAWAENPIRPTGMDLPESAEAGATEDPFAAHPILTPGGLEDAPRPEPEAQAPTEAARFEVNVPHVPGPVDVQIDHYEAPTRPVNEPAADESLVEGLPTDEVHSAELHPADLHSDEVHSEDAPTDEPQEERRVEIRIPSLPVEPAAEPPAPPPPVEAPRPPPLHVTDIDIPGRVAREAPSLPVEPPAPERIAVPPPSPEAATKPAPAMRFGAPEIARPTGPRMDRAIPPPPTPARAPAGTAPTGRTREGMPWPLWLLLGAGFLLLGGLLVAMLSGKFSNQPEHEDELVAGHGSAEGSAEGDTDGGVAPVRDNKKPFDGLFQAPTYGQGVRDGSEPRVIDASKADHRAALDAGVWVLVFVDPSLDAGLQTAIRAHGIHRSVVDRNVEVALVMPRAHFVQEGGWLPDKRAMREALQGMNIWDGMSVVLDPPTSARDPRGQLHRKYGRRGRSISNALLFRGGIESRFAPPQGQALTVQHFSALIKRALLLAKM